MTSPPHQEINAITISLDILRSMRSQEQKAYHVSYVGPRPGNLFPASSRADNKKKQNKDDHFCKDSDWKKYLTWRSQMITWFYNIVEILDFQKETVEIAMSIVDRYVAIYKNLITDGATYQLVCMTSLYIAAKIHEPFCLTPAQLESLGGTLITVEKIETMEVQILNLIQWRVNPPTIFAFARLLLKLIPSDYIHDQTTVLEIVQSQIELSIPDEAFMQFEASTIAVASLMNALKSAAILEKDHLCYYYGLFIDSLQLQRSTFKPRLEASRRLLRALVLNSLGLDTFSLSSSQQEELDEEVSGQPSTIKTKILEQKSKRTQPPAGSPRSVMAKHIT